MTYSNANFTPGLKGYSNVKPFRFWCQKVLPLVYDDSLSYYELLCKVVDYLNNVISDLSATEDNVGELLDAYNQLQDYVNNYFTNLDVQEEINNKLDAMFEDGTIPTMIEEYVHPFIEELNENYAKLDSQINETMTTQNENIATLTTRVNNLVINNTTNLTGYNVVTVESTTAEGGSTITENIPVGAEILQVCYSGYNDTNDTIKSDNISYESTPNVPSSTQQQVVVTITDSTDTRFHVYITYAVSQAIEIAELTDIRVGYDNTVYSSAGNAVRKQVGDLNRSLNYKFGFSNLENTTLINRESIGAYGEPQLAYTRRWFIPQIFKKNTYINKINFKSNCTTVERIIHFEVWTKSNDTLTKVKTISLTLQEPTVQQIAKIYTVDIDYEAENDCIISIISSGTYGSIIYENLNETENVMLASSNVDISATEISYSTLNTWYMDISLTIYCDIVTSVNIVTIGDGMDYDEIQPALQAIIDDSPTNPYTLLVMPRKTPYQPFTMLRNSFSDTYPWSDVEPRNISIIGINKNNCIIRSDSGDYKYPCGELMTNGIIKNLKFIMTNDEQTETATQGGYCLHIDCRTLNDIGYNMVIEDCDFEDASGPCLGIGMHKNCTLTVRRCNMKTTLSANYNPHEGYRNLVNYGVVFCHTSTLTDSTAQDITFEDCTGVCNEGNKSLQIASAGEYDPTTSEFTYTLLRNIFWNKAVNSSAYSISNNLTANAMNFGNNN